jgi:hypothetical protein
VTTRTLHVDARRAARWAAGFGERHGDVVATASDGGVLLHAADGATAHLTAPFPDDAPGTADVDVLVARALRTRTVAAVLARRGGYACAVVTTEAVLASKVGTRYVQGRTAAGGWSQQRFARRRENQTDDLVRATTEVAVRVLDASRSFGGVVTGGDRPLVDRVLADPRLARLAALPRGPHLAIGDPRSDVVKALPEAVRSLTILLTEP